MCNEIGFDDVLSAVSRVYDHMKMAAETSIFFEYFSLRKESQDFSLSLLKKSMATAHTCTIHVLKQLYRICINKTL